MADAITQADVLEARRLDPRRAVDRGKLQYLITKCGAAHETGAAGVRLREYVTAKLESTDPLGAKQHRLPWAGTAKADPFAKGSKELGATDVMWLQGLPKDPTKVSDDDARRLAALAMAVAPRSSDDVLMRSIFGPVKAHHERLAADAELSNARRLGNVEAERYEPAAVAALAAVIGADEPLLRPNEAGTRAREELHGVVEQVTTERTQRVAWAEQSYYAAVKDEAVSA